MESWADFDFGWIFGWLDFGWIWLGFGWIRVDFASLWLISLFILLRFSMISTIRAKILQGNEGPRKS